MTYDVSSFQVFLDENFLPQTVDMHRKYIITFNSAYDNHGQEFYQNIKEQNK